MEVEERPKRDGCDARVREAPALGLEGIEAAWRAFIEGDFTIGAAVDDGMSLADVLR